MNQKIAIIGINQARDVQWGAEDIVSAKPSSFLLALIEAEYQIFVCSYRLESSLIEQDRSWLDLIPRDQIYFRPGYDADYIDSWRKLFQRLDLSPPHEEDDWLDWKTAAVDQGVVGYRSSVII